MKEMRKGSARQRGRGKNDKKYNEDNNNLTEKKIDTRTGITTGNDELS
jgi:hypothetical protein